MKFEPHSHRVHPHLPIFRITACGLAALYTPGRVAPLSDRDASLITQAYCGGCTLPPTLSKVAAQLEAHAAAAQSAWLNLAKRAFEPVCLTVHLSNSCQLQCVYCYAAGPAGERDHGWVGKPLPRVNPRAVAAAARLVARNCQERSEPLQLVLHGGGEPTLHWDLFQEILSVVKTIGSEFDIDVVCCVSTNGVFSEAQARWVAANVDRVSLSIDGTPEIQNCQRPFPNGRPTADYVERTASLLTGSSVELSVRATITRQTVHRQAEIIAYLNARHEIRHFCFEPAYRANPGAAWAQNSLGDAARFVDHFLAAQYVARAIGCELQYSGVRLDEIHGPYCQVLRDVLQLSPDGYAVSCFLSTDGTQKAFWPHRVGYWDPKSESIQIDLPYIRALREQALTIPKQCFDCPNIYHCVRGCPDACPIGDSADPAPAGGFRCFVQQRLGCAWILNTLSPVLELDEQALPPEEASIAGAQLAQVPERLSAAGIAKDWLLASQRDLSQPRRAPDPIWATRGYERNGAEAWGELSGPIMAGLSPSPISIYVHVPFCDRRCAFCDCYSFAAANGDDARIEEYVKALLGEVRAWASLIPLNQCPVTTVHFGGGTPTFLRSDYLRAVVNELRTCFNLGDSTELALESTSSQIDPERLALLSELGFTRLHVGVQSLEDPVRERLGRSEPAAVVRERIRAALALGMVVTADVIYGLPGQGLAGFADTLSQLDSLGVHGFSLYRLNLTSHNKPFARKYGLTARNLTEQFFFFQVGEEILRSRNYRKTHFAHFSRPADRYLYYRHTRRGEDLLALGASADGVLGRFHYRHADLRQYSRNTNHQAPALLGGVMETDAESRLQPAIACLMTANLSPAVWKDLGATPLLVRWEREGLIAFDESEGGYILSANGSWFISEMLAELAAACPTQ
jgi:coproporphyrinogen III oxidase-like Fe-S oxidoreductase/pyruvate-formate lyase-activating enzyme